MCSYLVKYRRYRWDIVEKGVNPERVIVTVNDAEAARKLANLLNRKG